MADRYIVIIIILALIPLIVPFVAPEFVEIFIAFYASLYLLSLSSVSLIFTLFLLLAWKGERRLFVLSLVLMLSIVLLGLLLSFPNLMLKADTFESIYLAFLELSISSPILSALFLGLYFPVLSFGIWKLGRELAFIRMKNLMVGIVFSLLLGFATAVAIKISPHSLQLKDFLSISLILDLLVLFTYIVLVQLYWHTESRTYYSIIIAFFFFWFLGDITSLFGVLTYGLPVVFYALGFVSILTGILHVYRRDVAILDYAEVVEEKEKISELYTTTKELQEILSVINRMLRHDVKNKLQVILGYIEVYLLEKNEEYLERAIKAVEEMNEYLEKFRSLERALSAGIDLLKPMEVRKVVEDVLSFYKINHAIYGSCVALADESLYSVIDNLVNNAIKHGRTEKIDVYLSQFEDGCEIRIVDYGVGIPPEIKRRVFEEGFTVNQKTGTGIGLYVVKKVVQRYGGRVWVEDTKPKGATFVIRLRSPKAEGVY